MPFTKPSAKPNQQLNASALKPGVRQLRARLIANAPKRNPKLTPHQKKEARQRLAKGESTRRSRQELPCQHQHDFEARIVTEKQSEAETISGRDSFHKALGEIFSGIDLCLAQHLFSPTLLLVFSCMDAFSWIELSAIRDAKARFEAWVNKRMLPHDEVV